MKTGLKTPLSMLALGAASLLAALPAEALTTAEATGILYMKQEEKMARDIYQALATRWDQAVFRNIAAAEQRHMEAIDGLIARYGLRDETPTQAGRFSIPELQKLYDELVAQGQASLTAALGVGVTVEEADIADLREAIAASAEAPILRVLGNLLRASGQHLAAFQSLLAAGGTTTASVGTCPNAGSRCAGMGGSGPKNGQRAGDCSGCQAECQGTGTCPAPECTGGGVGGPVGPAAGKAAPRQPVAVPVRGRR